jgi:CheY-like chemotaxis protein
MDPCPADSEEVIVPLPVLVVENSSESADASNILRRAGYEVTTCAASEAVAVAKRQIPNVVVIEVSEAPDSTIRLLQHLHAHPRTCCTPMLLLSAAPFVLEDGLGGLTRVTVLSSPVPPRLLLEEVQRLTLPVASPGYPSPGRVSHPRTLRRNPATALWRDPRMRRTWGLSV